MNQSLEPAAPRAWTPGAGWDRLRREMPHLVPELAADDLRKADELIAEVKRRHSA